MNGYLNIQKNSEDKEDTKEGHVGDGRDSRRERSNDQARDQRSFNLELKMSHSC